ncbi:MAG: shikimate dehydrogenase [Verrucomicrobiota bacterium]|jgi:shikimate dehydrogenase|nr:shikimate dehydrogenase [Verrucomicrobiota bacterium]
MSEHKRDFLPSLVGSMSEGAAGNPTVEMVEAAFRHHDLHYRYVNMEVASNRLPDAIKGARALGFKGFNCSIPHKVAVIPHLDGLGESAAIMGAVNCVVKRDDRFIGENTDGKGFLESMKSVISPEGQHIVLLGAGGAARAIAVELALAGAGKISVINRSPDRGKELCQLINDQLEVASSYTPWEKNYKIPPDTDVLVNATSIGLYDGTAPLAIDLETLNPSTIVADVIFNPAETWLIRNARRIGCTALDGLGMIVNQGITSVAYWTGLRPDQSIMRNAVEKALRLE